MVVLPDPGCAGYDEEWLEKGDLVAAPASGAGCAAIVGFHHRGLGAGLAVVHGHRLHHRLAWRQRHSVSPQQTVADTLRLVGVAPKAVSMPYGLLS
jgi:hypothetical protein